MKIFDFEPLASHHLLLLHKWMQEPHVVPWWGEGRPWSLKDIEEKYRTYILGFKVINGEKKPIFPYVIYLDGLPVGFIQMYNALEFPRKGFSPQDIWREPASLAALDFYIGEPSCLGHGYGAEILRQFLKNRVFQSFDACLVDPEKENKIAIKTYANAGFVSLCEINASLIMCAWKKNNCK